ncbi:Uncharacterised protein [Bordetella pertussis]|nr:Uncharacterised protein [Bordetella pertussis]CFW00147.1 Uncharacterised protein [Bordetella pertussis]CFW36618.1 Uncharacterised protein [Bordetella pertussis]
MLSWIEPIVCMFTRHEATARTSWNRAWAIWLVTIPCGLPGKVWSRSCRSCGAVLVRLSSPRGLAVGVMTRLPDSAAGSTRRPSSTAAITPLSSLPCTCPLTHRQGPGAAPLITVTGMAMAMPELMVPTGR